MCVLVLIPYFKLPLCAHVYPAIHRTRKTHLRFPGTKHPRTRLSPLPKHLPLLLTLASEIYTPLPPHLAPKHENLRSDFFPISPFASGAIAAVWRGLHCHSVLSFSSIFHFRDCRRELCVRSFFFRYCRDRGSPAKDE